MTTLAEQVFQVAYVVRDLAAAERRVQAMMGVRYFERLEDVTLGAGCRHRGQPADASVHLALGYLGDLQIELIQPVHGTSIYSEFLDAGQAGLHHVAFVVPDVAAATAALTASGASCIADGVLEGGMRVEFAYFDGTPEASCIEILGFDDAAHAFMAEIKRKGAA